MQGYGTMASEAAQQLKAAGADRPTHIFVQAGVGSLAGAVQGYFANLFPDCCPTTVIMEAQAADCLYRSAEAADGNIRFATGDLKTIMAGLACGEPNTISFDILKNHAACFVSCPDWVAAKGMRMLGAPVKGGSPGDLRRVRRRGHGPHRDPDDGPGLCRSETGHRPGRAQRGADVLHRGRHRSRELQAPSFGAASSLNKK